MFILVGIWSMAMAVTGFAIFDLTGSTVAAWAAAAMPLVFAVTGLVPNGAWALPAVALAWAVTARVLPPHHAPPQPIVAAAAGPTG